MENMYRGSAIDLDVDQLAGIIDFVPDAVLAIDLDGRVIIWNKAMEEMTGTMAKKMIGRDNYEYAIPFYGFRRPILVDLANGPNQKLEGEYKNLQKVGDTLVGEVFIPSFGIEGSYIWAKAAPLYGSAGNVIGAIESIRDITKRRLAEDNLARQNALLKSIIESPRNVISFSLDRNYCYISFNQAHRQTMKQIWDVDICLGLNMLNAISYPEDRKKAKENFDRVLSGENFTLAEQYGDEALSRRYWEDNYSPIINDQGEVIGVTVFCLDITESEKAKEVLRRSEEHLRLAAEGGDLGTYTYDFVSGQGDWSPELKAFYGLRADEPLVLDGNGVAIALHPEDRSAFLSAMTAANDPYGNESGTMELDYRIIHTDGSIRWLRVHGRTEFIGESNDRRPWRAAGVIIDITKHKCAEEALKESRARYELAVQSAQMGSWVLDVVENKRDFDAQTCSLLGIDCATFEGSPNEFFRVVHPDDRSAIQTALIMSIEHDAPYESAYRVVHPDGSIRHIAARGRVIRDQNHKPLKLIGILWDDTESRRTEEALRESHQILDGIIKTIPVRVFWKDRDLVYLGCNEIFAHDAGFVDQKDIIGKDDYQMVWRDQAELYRADDRQVIDSGCPKLLTEEPQTTPEGKTIVLLTSKIPLRSSDGEIIGVIGTYMDITERKKAEEALRKSEGKLASIIDFLPDATLVIDNKKTVIAWNRAMEEMTGVAKDDMIGQGDYTYTVPFYGERRMHLLDLLDADDKDLSSKYQYVKKKGNILYTETYAPALNRGKGAYVWATGAPILDNQGNRIGAIESIRDITERKIAERTLQEQLNFLQQLIDSIPSPIFYKDTRGVYLGCNRAFGALTGLTKDKIVGQTVHRLYPKDLANIYYDADNGLFQDPGVQVYEATMAHADGSRRDVMFNKATYFDTEGRLAGLVGIILDITERKQMENALRESKRRLADIIDFLPDSTFVIDKDGKVIAWNRAIELLTGIKAKDMLGKGNYEHSLPFYGKRKPILIDLVLRPEEEIEKEYSNLQREGGILFGEAYMPMLSGGTVYLWGVASALYDSQGNIVGAIESIKDITERKRSEEILKASLLEKEVMLKEIHHRVKNNLQIVTSLLRIQSMSIQDKEALVAFQDSQNRIKSMALVHEKLYRSDDLSKVHIKEYINKLTFDLIRSFGSERKVKVYLNLKDVFLGIDKAIPFGLILNELITNCLKHAFPGNRMGEIRVGLSLEGNLLELTVYDNGIGMPEDLEISKAKSTGLMLVKALVSQLKGILEVKVNGGTWFKICIDT